MLLIIFFITSCKSFEQWVKGSFNVKPTSSLLIKVSDDFFRNEFVKEIKPGFYNSILYVKNKDFMLNIKTTDQEYNLTANLKNNFPELGKKVQNIMSKLLIIVL